ncbi:oleate hydratase [Aspergillus clavatus NRRL 1]|uniref:Streptococcal 67 kDa myosin-cross-reactive antigen like family protein n=1 Tax=Aspergillus clavatus (strain ATCC 1007 / CBS 513.65 / DSM 816 / NCTC 3887 / NRRL 1 / QM 1276 / 107) TaxID=344612 RepID=A1CU62_ASPCL|nr:streptococcal 67 kDa myosin-cross-reactive antigen like family protein [Aspergillus clavatus NRRL 1]EAW06849.1 streptococcal 67 kDa myosin-cross-reactive antigen like family protein [Aspergillus clavatus NRRL 1]
MREIRDPQKVQAWLIGSGIESLAAAVHLIHDAHVPGPNIHILDLHRGSGGRLKTTGDATNGYFLPVDCHPYFHGPCTERLLSLIPSDESQHASLMDAVNAYSEQRPPHEAHTRAVRRGESGPEVSHTPGFQLDVKHRMDLIWFLMETEHALGAKEINQAFDLAFFDTEFWKIWSTTFELQPWHSAVEFHRHLRKYLENIRSLKSVKTFHRTRYNLYDSIVRPLTSHLQSQGVDFRFNVQVTGLDTASSNDPTTVSEIHFRKYDSEEECRVSLSPSDICIAILGSTTTNSAMGSDDSPPPYLSAHWEDLLISEWGLWQALSRQSAIFGDPTCFLPRAVQASVESFTTTLHNPDFLRLIQNLTRDKQETDASLSLRDSNWGLTLSIPPQPVFPDQPEDVHVVLGYALSPASEGNFIRKHMFACSGREIFEEVLRHLGFPVELILPASSTIPCGLPLGTAPFLSREKGDRPRVIPANTTNIACVGQFVEIAEDTTLSLEYSVRGAQMAVSGLMGTPRVTGAIKKNILWEVFDLLK